MKVQLLRYKKLRSSEIAINPQHIVLVEFLEPELSKITLSTKKEFYVEKNFSEIIDDVFTWTA